MCTKSRSYRINHWNGNLSSSPAPYHRLERPSDREHAGNPRGRLPVLPAGPRRGPEGHLQSLPVLQAAGPLHHRPQVGQGQHPDREPQGERLMMGKWAPLLKGFLFTPHGASASADPLRCGWIFSLRLLSVSNCSSGPFYLKVSEKDSVLIIVVSYCV